MSPAASPTQQAWGRLWGTGVVDTFGHSGAAAGTSPPSPLAAHWRQALARLSANARVLDLGTGNGALPYLLLQSCKDLSVVCDAVDVVEPHPRWLMQWPQAERDRVRLHGGVSCERLPFPGAHFDLVVSQFGIEYADLDLALPEALRVLKADGTLRFAVHHVDARPAVLAREEIAHASWLLDSGWLTASGKMAEAMSLTGTPGGVEALNNEVRWQMVRHAFDRFHTQLVERANASHCPDLLLDAHGWLKQVFQSSARQGQEAAQAGMSTIAQLLRDCRLRLQDLLDHALDEARIEALGRAIQGSGRVVQIEPAQDGGHSLGRWVTAGPVSAALVP